jgi:hypothetical protein
LIKRKSFENQNPNPKKTNPYLSNILTKKTKDPTPKKLIRICPSS